MVEKKNKLGNHTTRIKKRRNFLGQNYYKNLASCVLWDDQKIMKIIMLLIIAMMIMTMIKTILIISVNIRTFTYYLRIKKFR